MTMTPNTESRERLITWSVFAVAIAIAAIALSDSLAWNFGYDQGTFAYGGSALLKGARPYLDFWDIKPPNIFYIYSLAFALFGESVRSIRVLDYINALTCVMLIWFLTLRLFALFGIEQVKNRWWVRIAGLMAVGMFVLSYLQQGYQDTAQAETYTMPLLLGSLLLVLPGKKVPSRIALFLSGGLIGVSCFFKFPFGLFILLPLLAAYQRGEEKWKSMIFILAGLATTIVIQALILLPSGELSEMWKIIHQATLSYNRNNFSGSFGIIQNLRTAVQMFHGFWLACGAVGCLMLFLGSSAARKRLLRTPLSLLFLGCIVALAIVQLQNKGYAYHYQILIPWVAVLTGIGMATLEQSFPAPGKLRKYLSPIGAFVLLLVGTLLFGHKALRDTTTPSELDRVSTHYIGGDDLSNYVLAHSDTNARIFIFGFQPYVYWNTHRAPANRFLNTIHFKPTYVNEELRQELITSLTKSPPSLLFVETGDHYTSQGDSFDDSRTTIRERYPEIERLLQTRYTLADTVGDILAYKLH